MSSDNGRERRGQPQRGKRRAGKIEEVRHRERVIAYAAMGQQCADVRHEWQIARSPQAIAKAAAESTPTQRTPVRTESASHQAFRALRHALCAQLE